MNAFFVLNVYYISLKCWNFYNLLPWKLIIKYSIPLLHIHLQTYNSLKFLQSSLLNLCKFSPEPPSKIAICESNFFLRYPWLSKFIYFVLYLTLCSLMGTYLQGETVAEVFPSPSFGTLVTLNSAISSSCFNIFAYSIDPLHRWSSPDALSLNPFFINSLQKLIHMTCIQTISVYDIFAHSSTPQSTSLAVTCTPNHLYMFSPSHPETLHAPHI